MGGDVAADGSNTIYNLQILHQLSNYFTIYECMNVMDVITLQRQARPSYPHIYLSNGLLF